MRRSGADIGSLSIEFDWIDENGVVGDIIGLVSNEDSIWFWLIWSSWAQRNRRSLSRRAISSNWVSVNWIVQTCS